MLTKVFYSILTLLEGDILNYYELHEKLLDDMYEASKLVNKHKEAERAFVIVKIRNPNGSATWAYDGLPPRWKEILRIAFSRLTTDHPRCIYMTHTLGKWLRLDR